jgi:hypothetical protein
MNNPIDYGDNVRVIPSAPTKFEPGTIASACGFRIIKNNKEAQTEEMPIGTKLWLLEKGDGSSFEVPEEFLARLE